MRKQSRAAGFTLVEILVVIAILSVVALIAAPLFDRTVDSFKIVGTARSVTNAMQVAKIRAASSYTRVRLYVDLSARTHKLQRFDKGAGVWVDDGAMTYLPSGVSFGHGALDEPPDERQPTIEQPAECKLHNPPNPPADIGNTACVIFNSRGLPIHPTTLTPEPYVLYMTDGYAVYAVTVAATGMVELWRSYTNEVGWVLQ